MTRHASKAKAPATQAIARHITPVAFVVAQTLRRAAYQVGLREAARKTLEGAREAEHDRDTDPGAAAAPDRAGGD